MRGMASASLFNRRRVDEQLRPNRLVALLCFAREDALFRENRELASVTRTTPATGLDAAAYSFFGMRPARNASPSRLQRRDASPKPSAPHPPPRRSPCSSARHRRPISMATAASDAVPTPASTISGTSVMRSRRIRSAA